MRRFSLYLRNGVYYAQLYNPKSGTYMYGRSTGKSNRDEAAGIATDWLKNGIPVQRTKQKRSIETRMTLDAIHLGLQNGYFCLTKYTAFPRFSRITVYGSAWTARDVGAITFISSGSGEL